MEVVLKAGKRGVKVVLKSCVWAFDEGLDTRLAAPKERAGVPRAKRLTWGSMTSEGTLERIKAERALESK